MRYIYVNEKAFHITNVHIDGNIHMFIFLFAHFIFILRVHLIKLNEKTRVMHTDNVIIQCYYSTTFIQKLKRHMLIIPSMVPS